METTQKVLDNLERSGVMRRYYIRGAGAVTTTYAYEPFGKTTITGTSSNPFQYTGRENDGTGLYYYRARYYNPSLGRFFSEDWFPTTNRYPYVLSNPLAFKDPLGLLVLGAGAGGTLATPVIAGDVTIAGVVDSNGNYANIAYGGVSTGLQIAAVAGPSVVFAPFANIDDLSGKSFDIQLRLLVQLTISIPIETSVKDGKTVVDPQFGKTVFTLDFVPGLNIGLGFGIGSTSVSKTINLAKVLSGRK